MVDTALAAGLMQAMGNPMHALFQFADTGSYAASLTADAVFKLATEQASINLSVQLANIALGFQTSLSVRSVFDTMLTTVFDIGIQGLAPIPTYADTLGARLSLSLVHAAENLIESYTADAITGTSTHLDGMIAQAIGVALSTAITTREKPKS